MEHKHQDQIVTALEPLINRFDELVSILGPAAAPTLARVQQRLIEAMAARDRGDSPAAFQRIGEAMNELTVLASTLDPVEGMVMRSVAESFQRAITQGREAEAKANADVMMQRSGAVERKKDT